jgi:hypothetical protein
VLGDGPRRAGAAAIEADEDLRRSGQPDAGDET